MLSGITRTGGGRVACAWAIGLSILGAGTLAVAPANGLNIVLNFEDTMSSSPSFDPFTGTNAPTGLRRMFEFAEDFYEDVFETPHTLTINYWYADLNDNLLGLHNPVSQSGGRVNESNIRIDTNRANGNLTNWFIDPTPDTDNEYNMQQTLWRDLTGTQQTDWYNFSGTTIDTFEVGFEGNATAAAAQNAADMLSVVLHEVGHALGMSSGNNSTVAETADGDYDYDSVNIFGRTLAIETANNSGDDNLNIAHVENTDALMTPSLPNSTRRLPSHSDLLAMAAVHNYTAIDIPRREFYGGGNWNSSGNWTGDTVPGGLDDVFVRDSQGPGVTLTASLSAQGNGRDLELSEGANVDTNAFLLNLSGDALITGFNTDLFINPGGELDADEVDIEDQAEIEMSGGTLDARRVTIDAGTQIESTAGGSATVQISERLVNNGTLRASGDSLLFFSTTTPTPWDADGTTGNGNINASNGRVWFDTGAMTDGFGGEITVGDGQFFRFDAPWTLDGGGVVDLNGGAGTADRARIIGGVLTATGSATIEAAGQAEFDNAVVLGPNVELDVADGANLEFNSTADVDGTDMTIARGGVVEFQGTTDLTGVSTVTPTFTIGSTQDARIELEGQTNYASYTLNKAGGVELIVQQTGDARFVGTNTINADIFDMDGNIGNNTLTFGDGINSGSLILNVDGIDTSNEIFNGTIDLSNAGFSGKLTVNLTEPTTRWRMAGVMELSGNAFFFLERFEGTRFEVTGDINVSNSLVSIDADVDLLDTADVAFAGTTSNLGFRGFTQITAGVSFSGPGTVTAQSGSELFLLDGVNLFNASLRNDGSLSISGTGAATVDDFAQGNGGQWNVNLAGSSSTLYDVLVSDDEISIDGTLSLSLTGGYLPNLYTTTHTILNGIFGASLAGIFDDVLGVVQDGFGLAVLYTSQDIRVRAALLGDANLNQQVEQGDLDAVLQNWGLSNFSGASVSWVTGDLNGNGTVEQGDLDLVLQNWGDANAPDFRGVIVPEPAASGLAALLLLTRRRTDRVAWQRG